MAKKVAKKTKASKKVAKTTVRKTDALTEGFGDDVFGLDAMKKYLSAKTYQLLAKTINTGSALPVSIADEAAEGMKQWARDKGATHFTHWFQPLTGSTAEKHDSFVTPDFKGGAVLQFSGKELIQGEPDASSFPSGGLRETFEARGYTGWDPTSPAFIKRSSMGATLCIPTVFCGYHGEALDKKTPVLRSMSVLSDQITRLGKFFGVKGSAQPIATLGAEQEYFLIDAGYYEHRLDLQQTGRTLFGKVPAKHQQLDDHYFGAIKPRVIDFMDEVDSELWKLGIPARTRHNEVCPAQFELAPMFESLNLAIDHNMIMMEVLQNVAERHDFVCLLHEKPYAGVNGSGKHNNWAVAGADGKNWLSPGDTPHDNAKFLTVICALIQAVDKHADLLRAVIATAGNDHRLGANEAPPVIISIFLGEQLFDIIEQIEKGGAKKSKDGGVIEIGVTSMPDLPRDATDRNRTSPFAFTGNKFEFRAAGSNQSCAGPNVVLNTIVSEALDDICSKLDKANVTKATFNAELQKILKGIIKKHKRVLFNGDNYTDAWLKEAAKRGLPNLKKTTEALAAITSKKSVALFEKYNVLSKAELESRYNVYIEGYEEALQIECRCMISMAQTIIAPVAIDYQGELGSTIKAIGDKNAKSAKAILKNVSTELDKLMAGITKLEKAAKTGKAKSILAAQEGLRAAADAIEGLVPAMSWPMPTYAEMLFTY